jgi:hypothetical protein
LAFSLNWSYFAKNHNIAFQENRDQILRRKMVIDAENCAHNIDPWGAAVVQR